MSLETTLGVADGGVAQSKLDHQGICQSGWDGAASVGHGQLTRDEGHANDQARLTQAFCQGILQQILGHTVEQAFRHYACRLRSPLPRKRNMGVAQLQPLPPGRSIKLRRIFSLRRLELFQRRLQSIGNLRQLPAKQACHLGRLARRTSLVYFRGTELPGVGQLQLLSAGFADLVPENQVDSRLHRESYTGLERAEMFVAHVDAGSPADSAGLRPGDLVTALDGAPVSHWVDLDQRLQAEPTRTFKLTWKRATGATTETMSAEVTQVWRRHLDDYDHTVSRLVFGARNDVDRGAGATVAIEGRFGFALSKGFERTRETIAKMVSEFFRILGGDQPGDALGGPLMMYRVASVSGNQGWDSFLLMLALISINLGLINLLPIPMLDGGHLLVFAVEAARRRTLSTRARERVQLAGLIVIGLITVLAVRNDILRYLIR